MVWPGHLGTLGLSWVTEVNQPCNCAQPCPTPADLHVPRTQPTAFRLFNRLLTTWSGFSPSQHTAWTWGSLLSSWGFWCSGCQVRMGSIGDFLSTVCSGKLNFMEDFLKHNPVDISVYVSNVRNQVWHPDDPVSILPVYVSWRQSNHHLQSQSGHL